ncbi:MAG: TraR/DksA family transcriptional regulator [Patescibacteria group bacterium]|nr:TraR/DksA family transcriptional regulator [Patescibacteria group bacterium]
MEKAFLEKQKKKLEKEKTVIENQLKSFAKRDEKLKEDWDTIFPKWNGEAGGASLERAADEVEEYSTLLPIEYALETRLRNINLALEKIKKGRYGKCERCGKPIPKKRLKVSPEARFCLKCKK